MATLTFGYAKGVHLTRVLGQSLAHRTQPLLTQPRKCLAVTPVLKGRIYGPDETQVNPTGVSGMPHWKMERYLSAALLPVIPVALIAPNPVLDVTMAATVVLHTHWGLEVAVSDYIHGSILPKICKSLLLGLSTCAFAGLIYFSYADIGLGKAIVMFYSQL